MVTRFSCMVMAAGLGLGVVSSRGEGWVEWEAWPEAGGEWGAGLEGWSGWEEAPRRWNRVDRFESAKDFGENFAARMRGKFTVQAGGVYVFELEVEGKALARLREAGGAWRTVVEAEDGTRQGPEVWLEAGRGYELEVLHHAGEGPDGVKLGWTCPAGRREMPISAEGFSTVSGLAAIERHNVRKGYVEPYLRSYDREAGLARDRHAPRPNEFLTRETVYAAGAMLETGEEKAREEAIRALRKVLPYQNTSERASSFGNWPKVVQRPGDFNAQNIGGFIGAELILILERHGERLPPELVEELEAALRRAAIRGMRYNPPVTATNIVTKAVTVALLADQRLELPEVGAWARAKLAELHAHTQITGLGTEYNSPTYNGVVRRSLGMLKDSLKDEEARRMVEDLHRAAWREIAWNYNPHLGQWTGPTARRYWDMHGSGGMLQLATNNRMFFGANAFERSTEEMPAEFAWLFERTEEARGHRFTVFEGQAESRIIDQRSLVPLVATLHHTPVFSLGSFNRGDLWDQRRAIIAYWGRADTPGVFRLATPTGRAGLLAAQVNTLQEANHLVAAVTFATDAGWGVAPWDLYNPAAAAPPTVKEVRLRFLTAGPTGGGVMAAPRTSGGTITHAIPGGRLELRLLAGSFGGKAPRWEATSEGLDLVLDAGEETPLAELREAAVAVSISLIADERERAPAREARLVGRELHLRLGDRRVRVPASPVTYAALQVVLAAQPDFANPNLFHPEPPKIP